tara:strand:- start:597 stop:1031 length:435 start_codon:yes stop_codon:yes gene_type:complete
MKDSLIILIILIPILSFSQTLEEKIENLPISYHSGCDTLNHRTQWGYQEGELALDIEIESAVIKKDKISICGILQDKQTEEPVPYGQIFTAIFQDDYCEIIKFLTSTNKNGRFEVNFQNSEDLSLIFEFVSYLTLELKIGELNN